MQNVKFLKKRPRARLELPGDIGDTETENVVNVFIPNIYLSAFRSRVSYLERFYQVKVLLSETQRGSGSDFLATVSGKSNGVNATLAALSQWASGCTNH